MRFGFLLSLPFTNRFRVLDGDRRALHRDVARDGGRDRLSHHALVGIVATALALTGSVALVTTLVNGGVAVPVAMATVGGVFVGRWFVLPLGIRWSGGRVARRSQCPLPKSISAVRCSCGVAKVRSTPTWVPSSSVRT